MHPGTEIAMEVDPSWRKLVHRPSTATLRKIWQRIPRQDRQLAILAALAAASESVLDWLHTAIARQRHFRRRTVTEWSEERLASAGAMLVPDDREVLEELLRHLHLGHRAEMLGAYLDALGIPHKGGEADKEPTDPPPVKRVEEAAAGLLRGFPADQVLAYLLTLRALQAGFVPGIDKWLQTLLTLEEVEGEVREMSDGAVTDVNPEPERTDEFTTVDRHVVRAVVDCAQHVEGALDRDEVLDMILELIELNSSRHRSFFHLGFADVLFDQGARDSLPAQNESRMKWYWSGFVNGLARSDRWDEICELFDGQPGVRVLGQGGGGPHSTAAPLVFRALAGCGRPGEAAEFLSVPALVEHPQLAVEVHNHGRDLIWQDRAPEARSLMDLLGRYLEFLESQGHDTATDFLLDVRRRRAHCYRQLGELKKARGILEHLLTLEYDSEIRAMALTDMGLIDGGFRNLAEVRLPQDEEVVPEVGRALEDGETLFRAGANANARYSAHGRYCLGVLAMIRKEWSEATRNLEVALSVFDAEPDRYGVRNLVAHARLYLGVSLSLELDAIRAQRATELILQGLDAGVKVPGSLLEPTVQSLGLTSMEQARILAIRLLEDDPDALDSLVSADLLRESEALIDAILERAADASRPMGKRAADLRTVLGPLLERNRVDDASMVLDGLEAMARDEVGRDEFVELLEEPGVLDPAWDVETTRWSRIHLLRLKGDYGPARESLRGQFFKALNSERYDAHAEAEDILELFSELDPPEEALDALRRALASARPDDKGEGLGIEARERTVRVLFVGGDERQEVTTREIKSAIEEEIPKLKVDFLHPGWSGNWGGTLDQVRESLPRYDAVVVMRFIRTELGRQIRRIVDVPWTACSGAGQATIRRSVLRAAEWGRQARKNKEPDNG